ncbi:PadR family transcriptional regulator [Nocardia araoensis]|uniref:PadR family transcriptional regulator n=1 Tax=Nocardia araoensis TaxID=228600 RepID=UPI0002EBBCCF|nr:PadR family transcriptional regulator [Nocardia araoensis]
MALRNAVLAQLVHGEASGYELAKGFDASVANFWMATPQQLYRELDRMATEGLIDTQVVQQDRRPNKRVHTMTPAGREALHDFIGEPTKPGAMRDDLLVKVHGMDTDDVSAVRAAVAERLEWAQGKLDRYERLRTLILDGRTEQAYLAESDRIGPYLTLLRGLTFEQENVRWAEFVLKVLDRRSVQHF